MDVEALKNELLTDEGFSQFACKGGSGKGTPAFGRETGAAGIAMHEALHTLDNDIRRVQRELDKFFPWRRRASGNQLQQLYFMIAFALAIWDCTMYASNKMAFAGR
jgi:hypothetical protein